MYACMHVYISIYVCVCVYVCVCIYIYMYVCVYDVAARQLWPRDELLQDGEDSGLGYIG